MVHLFLFQRGLSTLQLVTSLQNHLVLGWPCYPHCSGLGRAGSHTVVGLVVQVTHTVVGLVVQVTHTVVGLVVQVLAVKIKFSPGWYLFAMTSSCTVIIEDELYKLLMNFP